MKLAAAAFFVAVSVSAQPLVTRATMCQAVGPAEGAIVTRQLVACAEGLPDNLLWHLDRADSVDGRLDGRVTQRTTGRGARRDAARSST